MSAQTNDKGTDVKTTAKNLLGKEEELLVRALGQTMKKYHEEPTAKNLRNLEATKKALAELKAKTPVEDEHELALENAHKKALAALNKRATAENIRAVEAAKRALADHQARTAGPAERRFANLTEALEYLKSEGWKVEKSKLYADQGKITKEKDGTYTVKALDDYARLCLQRKDGSNNTISLAEKKAEADLDGKLKDNWLRQREIEEKEGKWELTSKIDAEFAEFAAYTKNAVGPEFIHRAVERLIEIADGDPKRAPEVIEYWLKEVDELFDRHAVREEYTVPAATE